MCQCKTMSGTCHWHVWRCQLEDHVWDMASASISIVCVRPCLGHGIDLMDEPV
ncbi:hypothetical protein F383_15447 [Gossypium arboreum]|uniref:Uncharacterized protein n=1 Tax=Gossypium arboreum TaxID=29729 RepID=A0A0B0ND19_GOSAR|nr:hypothetical protein F383_15447 [Gossypium arboreum]